jgi:hypothetical protein
LTRTRAQFSFRHAPVLKGIFFASAAATFACYPSKYAADFVEVCTRHPPIRQPRLRAPPTHPQAGEAFASTRLAASKHALRFLPFRVVSDAVFGLYMLHWIRCFERMMGPRK